jgi:hypothetical protein
MVLAVVCTAGAAAALLQPVVLWVNDAYHTGGAYTAIQAAPDGRVYLGTTFYNGFGRLLVLPPGGREFQLITDTATATGENRSGPYAQAKIHSKPAVAPDGKVYFATKSGEPALEAAQSPYPGGHLLVYDPQTNRTTDLGIPRPHQSIIAVGVDPRRNLVYTLTDPEVHLIVYDPRSRTFSDRGEFAPRPPTRYLVVLSNGDAFHPAPPDAVMRYNAAAGRIERLTVQYSGGGRYESPYALAAGGDGTRFYGVGEESGQVYTFAPGERSVAVQSHGAAVPEGFALPGSHYTMTAAPDGNVYYTAVLRSGGGSTLFIERLATRTGRTEVVGQVGALPATPPSGAFASHVRRSARGIMIQGSTAGPDGTLYVMTAYPLRVLVFSGLARP